MIEMFIVLMMGHAVADQGLQSDWVAKNKRRDSFHGWWVVLASHGLIHGLAVYLITHSMALGVAETVAHSLIDFGKCEGKYGLEVDQMLHILCKIIWVAAVFGGLVVPF